MINKPELVPIADPESENAILEQTKKHVTMLRQVYDTNALPREIKFLQEASRIQHISPLLKDNLLKELQRRKTILGILQNE